MPTGTVTFLFTDIEGSTRLLKSLGRDRYSELLAAHNRLLRSVFSERNGLEIETKGDSFFVVFRSAAAAVEAAGAGQRALASHEWPDGADVRVRMGLHTGEASVGSDGYVGFAVHQAARVGDQTGGRVFLFLRTDDFDRDYEAFRARGLRVRRPDQTLATVDHSIPTTPRCARRSWRADAPRFRSTGG